MEVAPSSGDKKKVQPADSRGKHQGDTEGIFSLLSDCSHHQFSPHGCLLGAAVQEYGLHEIMRMDDISA